MRILWTGRNGRYFVLRTPPKERAIGQDAATGVSNGGNARFLADGCKQPDDRLSCRGREHQHTTTSRAV